jgi:hypothetical protein
MVILLTSISQLFNFEQSNRIEPPFKPKIRQS